MTAPIVNIAQGKVRGIISEDVDGNKFYSFLGIPYAKPPVGDLRFKGPIEADPWEGIFDASKEGNSAIQKDLFSKEMIGSEDCLNLNVYTTKIPEPIIQSKLKPVMVFIHGGAFINGSNSRNLYGPDFLIAEDIVLVVINYRLGLFGFLSLDNPKLNIPGNAAFKDMVLALKWVQQNIINFNGDLNNVTIFGESAGSASVHFMMLSPLARGLFHKVICQSSCALNGWTYARKNSYKEVAKLLNFDINNQELFLNQIQNATAEDIYNAQCTLDNDETLGNKCRYLGLVIEKPSETAFISKPPIELIKSGEIHRVPLMIGYNTGEGMLYKFMVKRNKRQLYFTDKELHVPDMLQLVRGSALSKSLGEKIMKYYLGDGPYSFEDLEENFYKLTSDNCFIYGILNTVRYQAKKKSSPIYFYRMTVETELNIFKKLSGIQFSGVCHADDLGYLFKTAFTPNIRPNSVEDVSRRRFCKLWTNFAKYGNPTVALDKLINIKWTPVNSKNINYLDIGTDLKMEENPDREYMEFWDNIYSASGTNSKL